MMYKSCLFIFSFFTGSLLFAQKNDLNAKLALIEKSNAPEKNITELNKILASSNLTAAENIAIQTAIVHQYQELRQWDTCIRYCQAQIALAQKQNNKLAEASFYKLQGNTCYHIPDKEKALAYWKKCVAISETINENLLLEQCYHNIGTVLLENPENYAKAEGFFQKAISLSIANKTDTTELGNLHYRMLATLYEITDRLKEAGTLYIKVIARARELNDSLRLAEGLMFYSKVLSKEKKFANALAASKEALVVSEKFNKLDMLQSALSALSEVNFEAGNYKEAYRYLNEHNHLYIERFNTDLNSKISEAEVKFKTSELQHENEIASVKAKKEKQVYLTGFAGLLVLASFAFYYFYQKRSIKQKIQMQVQVQQEKERLSRDLHDNLGSQMALLSNNVENLDTNYRKQLGIDENIDRVKGTSKQLLQTLRETIWILDKEQVTAQEFFDKLVDYAHRFLQSYPGIQLQVAEKFTGSKQLNSNEALQLFRICQEAITNSCKYAGGEVLKLDGKTEQGVFTIHIADSGKGFNAKEISKEGHYGLKNMQKRAADVHADMQIITAAGDGTNIQIKV